MNCKDKQEIINNKVRAIFNTIETNPEEWTYKRGHEYGASTYIYSKGDVEIRFSYFFDFCHSEATYYLSVYVGGSHISLEGLAEEFKVFHDKYKDFLHCQGLKKDIEILEKAGF